MKNSFLEKPKTTTGTEYKSENKAPLLHRARMIGSTIARNVLEFVAPKWGPEAEARGLAEYNKHMADKHLAPLRETYTRKAEVLQAYNDAVNKVLPGQRPQDPSKQRLVTGEYAPQNAPDKSANVQVSVFDLGRKGATRTNENNKGVILTRNVTLEDGAPGYRRETYTPGLDETLRVQSTDYRIDSDGRTIVQEHSAGWASDKIGGAEATPEQASFIQEIVFTGDTKWDQPTIRPIPQQ
jgi:hypothetical protein